MLGVELIHLIPAIAARQHWHVIDAWTCNHRVDDFIHPARYEFRAHVLVPEGGESLLLGGQGVL
jgi:hypothetical protein